MELKMKKATKVLVAGACAAALMVGSALPAMAATQTDKTNVSYDTSTVIPGTANWGVQIPRAIVFSDKMNERVKADVQLINTDGGTLDDIQQLPLDGVDVSVSSAKGMIMSIDGVAAGQEDPIKYEISYTGATPNGSPLLLNGTNLGTGKTVVMATLSDVNHTAVGLAERKDIAGSNGSHTDVLTFTFDNGVVIVP